MYIDFDTSNLKSINIFTLGLSFPVALAAYTEAEERIISSFPKNFPMTGNQIARWCRENNIAFRC